MTLNGNNYGKRDIKNSLNELENFGNIIGLQVLV